MSKSKLKPIEGNLKITSFFGATAKEPTTNSITETSKDATNIEPITISTTDTPKAVGFYESCVIEKIENCTPCSIEHIQLKEQLTLAKNRLNEIKKATDFCRDICRYKDEEIKQLQAGRFVVENLPNHAVQSQPPISQLSQSMPVEPKPFSKFDNSFSEHQLSELRSVKVAKAGDSNFVLKGVRFLYSSNLAALSKKSVRGTSRNKTAVSPEKLNLMKAIFDERLEIIGINQMEQEQRAKRFNTLFHTAINNINKNNQNQIDSELVDKINKTYSEIEKD